MADLYTDFNLDKSRRFSVVYGFICHACMTKISFRSV
jgi:hypothetical protein